MLRTNDLRNQEEELADKLKATTMGSEDQEYPIKLARTKLISAWFPVKLLIWQERKPEMEEAGRTTNSKWTKIWWVMRTTNKNHVLL
jgi:hypothetical protein